MKREMLYTLADIQIESYMKDFNEYLKETIQCPMCCMNYNFKERLPYTICTNFHNLCKKCVQIYFPKIKICLLCKKEMKEEFIVQDKPLKRLIESEIQRVKKLRQNKGSSQTKIEVLEVHLKILRKDLEEKQKIINQQKLKTYLSHLKNNDLQSENKKIKNQNKMLQKHIILLQTKLSEALGKQQNKKNNPTNQQKKQEQKKQKINLKKVKITKATTLTKEAKQNQPKRPINAYFKFRYQKMRELPYSNNRNEIISQMWKNIDPKQKKQLEDLYQSQLKQFPIKLEAWKKHYNIDETDLKNGRRTKKNEETDEEDMPIKTKGSDFEKQQQKQEILKNNEIKTQNQVTYRPIPLNNQQDSSFLKPFCGNTNAPQL